MGSPDADLVVLGAIAGAHGIAGELRIFPFNPDSANLERAKSVHLRLPDGTMREHAVVRSRRHKQFFLVKLAGFDDRDAADGAKGWEVALPRAELQPTEAGEFYIRDLVGASVTTDEGRALGLVVDVFEAGAAPVMVVRAEGSPQEHLIACTDDSITRMDLDAKTVVVLAGAVVSG